MQGDAAPASFVYRFPIWVVAVAALVAAALYVAFGRAIDFMVAQWNMDEFSHGYLIPFIAAYLIWRRRGALSQIEFTGSWWGVALLVLGLGLELAGRLSALYVLQHFAFLIVIAGIVYSLTGWRGLHLLAAPLGVLVFMIPLPNILLNTMSAELQLISSAFGVWMIRLFGVPVFLEGNVIDLGPFKLEVAEACSGLRYLLPLMTLAFLMACFYRVALWKRLVLFVSSVPITLVMNSLRIAAIGVMVDRWGIGMAEGALHQVQGWMIFMLSTAILVLEAALLARIGPRRKSWREVFTIESSPPPPAELPRRQRILPAPIYVSSALIVMFSAAVWAMPKQAPRLPQRESFATFPLQLADWRGQREAMASVYRDVLNLDDYLLANYARQGEPPVNIYVAWNESQSAGESTHSPKACLPGGGWRIVDLSRSAVQQVKIGTEPLQVNRALIEYGDQRELVYYWFLQRGRVVTNEYLVKWYLLLDALTRHRTDGALVRLIVPLSGTVTVAQADRELSSFASQVVPRLTHYVPS